MIELTLTAKDLQQFDFVEKPHPSKDSTGRDYRVGDVVLRPTIYGGRSAYLNLVKVTKITATSITVGNLDGSGGVRLQRPARALIVGRVNG